MVAERSVTPEEALPRPSHSGGGHLRLVESSSPPPLPELPPYYPPEAVELYYTTMKLIFFKNLATCIGDVPIAEEEKSLFHPMVETAEQRAYNQVVQARYAFLEEHGGPDIHAYVASRKPTHLGEQPSPEIPHVEPGMIRLIPFYMVEESIKQDFPPEIEETVSRNKGTIFEETQAVAMAADE